MEQFTSKRRWRRKREKARKIKQTDDSQSEKRFRGNCFFLSAQFSAIGRSASERQFASARWIFISPLPSAKSGRRNCEPNVVFISVGPRAAYRQNTSLIMRTAASRQKKQQTEKKGGTKEHTSKWNNKIWQRIFPITSDRLRVIFKSFGRKFIEPPRLAIGIVNSGHALPYNEERCMCPVKRDPGSRRSYLWGADDRVDE